MDHLVGPKATDHISPQAFENHERLCREGCLGVFNAMATMGRPSEVSRVRELLMEELEDAKIRCAPSGWRGRARGSFDQNSTGPPLKCWVVYVPGETPENGQRKSDNCNIVTAASALRRNVDRFEIKTIIGREETREWLPYYRHIGGDMQTCPSG